MERLRTGKMRIVPTSMITEKLILFLSQLKASSDINILPSFIFKSKAKL